MHKWLPLDNPRHTYSHFRSSSHMLRMFLIRISSIGPLCSNSLPIASMFDYLVLRSSTIALSSLNELLWLASLIIELGQPPSCSHPPLLSLIHLPIPPYLLFTLHNRSHLRETRLIKSRARVLTNSCGVWFNGYLARRATMHVLHHLSRRSDGIFLEGEGRTTSLDGSLSSFSSCTRCFSTPVKACLLEGVGALAAAPPISDMVGSEEENNT